MVTQPMAISEQDLKYKNLLIGQCSERLTIIMIIYKSCDGISKLAR